MLTASSAAWRRLAFLFLLLIPLVQCGGLPGDFESLTLEQKVAAYEEHFRDHGRSRIYARSHISWHGWQAADLMSEYIQGGRQGLPVLEALEIIHLVQARGCPLAGTAAEEALRDFLAREPRDTVDHLFAQTTLDAIENNAVTPGGPDQLKNGPCEEHKRKEARQTPARSLP